MTEKTVRERVCDGCGRDLTQTDLTMDWHYVLYAEPTPRTFFTITNQPYSNLPGTRHFCGDACVERWVTTIMKSVAGA